MSCSHLTTQWLGDLNDFIYEKGSEISNLSVSALAVMVVVSGVTGSFSTTRHHACTPNRRKGEASFLSTFPFLFRP